MDRQFEVKNLRSLSSRRSRAAQSLVETAMIAPILILMLISVVDFGRAAYVYSTLSNDVREGARTAVHTGATRPTNTDVVAAVRTYGIGLSLSSAGCVNGASTSPTMPSPTAPNTGWIYVAGGPGNASTNAPSGQAAAPAAGGCAAINPSYAGSYLLSVTVKYYFQPLTPLAEQFLGSGLVMTVTSTMSTEY